MADLYPFKDKVIAITGASRGTGLATARYLLLRGAKVSMCATSAENLAKAVSGIEQDIPNVQGRIMTHIVDVCKPEEVKAWIDATVARWGPLDGAANIAAKMGPRIWPIELLPVEDLNEMLQVNVVGVFNCLKEQMKNMKSGGSIVNCGSQQVQHASGLMSAYAASKNAVTGLTMSAAYEGSAKGIRVNLLSPGCIATDMIEQPLQLPNGQHFTMTEDENLTSLIKRFSKPEEIAASIAFLLGDECPFITREEIKVQGGWLESNYVG
ncbi:hypothetical protein MCOR03_004093 [Pyricularia oryzae]|nr:hypothetical protein MCOR03_004093 [Pyricularia oryzae]